jgi:hypothetical protein
MASAPMHAVNLIPTRRRWLRRRAVRLRLWACVLGAASLGTGAVCVTMRLSLGGVGTGIDESFQTVEASIDQTKRLIGQRQSALAEVQDSLRTSGLIADQPDWGLLLIVVGQRLGDETVLTHAHLEPMDAGGASASARAGSARSARFWIEGIGRSHDTVSRLAIGLEETGLFSGVRLVHTRRIEHDGADAVAFRIDCTLEGLPGGEP